MPNPCISPRVFRILKEVHGLYERAHPVAPAAGPTDPVAATEEDLGSVVPDKSGWSPHPSERRDFYHRIRVFPPDVAAGGST